MAEYQHDMSNVNSQMPEAQGTEEVRTLFVSGLPHDVREREVWNAFRLFQGFESARMNGRMPVAFVAFVDQASALAARQKMTGVRFDPDSPSILRIELAKSNSKSTSTSKRSRGDGYSESSSFDKRHRTYNGEYGATGYGATGYGVAQPMAGGSIVPGFFNDLGQGMAYPSMNYMDPTGYSPFPVVGGQLPGTIASALGGGSRSPPCATLFVANLTAATTETELRDIFSRMPGFSRMRMNQKDGLPVAFVHFQDINYSTNALNTLQGSMLKTADQGGMRLEYARNPMGTPSRSRPIGA